MVGAYIIKLFDASLCLRVLILLTAVALKASHPIPQTPSVGCNKIFPCFNQSMASSAELNLFKFLLNRLVGF